MPPTIWNRTADGVSPTRVGPCRRPACRRGRLFRTVGSESAVALIYLSEQRAVRLPPCAPKLTLSIHTKEYAYFIERLQKARLDAGLTQIQVTKKLGRPQSHISNVESGQQRVDVVELKRFAKMYKKDINYFIK